MYFYKAGDKYQGEWISDARMGRGRMEYANGDVYDGEWLDDKRHGMGILVLGVCTLAYSAYLSSTAGGDGGGGAAAAVPCVVDSAIVAPLVAGWLEVEISPLVSVLWVQSVCLVVVG